MKTAAKNKNGKLSLLSKKAREIIIKLKKAFPILLIFSVMLIIVIKPDTYIKSARDGLLLFSTSVLPALFPFFFFSGLLTRLGAAETLGKIFYKPMSKLYRTSPLSAYVFFMSVLCGYPVGAKLIEELYASGKINHEEAKSMASFCSTSGPIFIIGTAGAIMLGNKIAGALILLCHILGALINGFLYRGKKGDTPLQPPETKNKSSDNILSESMAQATLSMLAVGGYICVFNVLIDAAVNLNIISAMTTLVPFAPDAATEALLCGIIEMTRGCALLKYAGLTKPMTYSLAGAIISFGGLSVLFQTITFLGKCKIKTGTVLLQKLTQSIITFILCFALFSIFKI